MSWDWEELKKQQQAKRAGMNLKEEKKSIKLNKQWLIIPIQIILLLILIVLFWNIGRWAHYKYGYEKKVEQKVIEMVKPEALKEKYKKERM